MLQSFVHIKYIQTVLRYDRYVHYVWSKSKRKTSLKLSYSIQHVITANLRWNVKLWYKWDYESTPRRMSEFWSSLFRRSRASSNRSRSSRMRSVSAGREELEVSNGKHLEWRDSELLLYFLEHLRTGVIFKIIYWKINYMYLIWKVPFRLFYAIPINANPKLFNVLGRTVNRGLLGAWHTSGKQSSCTFCIGAMFNTMTTLTTREWLFTANIILLWGWSLC